jgi:hypothetical protein
MKNDESGQRERERDRERERERERNYTAYRPTGAVGALPDARSSAPQLPI